jgi:hypothetical protein
VELGKVYRWRSDSVIIERDCGSRLNLTRFASTCGECGEDYATGIEEELAACPRSEQIEPRPWRHNGERVDIRIPF